jgi:hypothetical protein
MHGSACSCTVAHTCAGFPPHNIDMTATPCHECIATIAFLSCVCASFENASHCRKHVVAFSLCINTLRNTVWKKSMVNMAKQAVDSRI